MAGWRPTAGLLERALDSIPPTAGAEVMGTGIVSIALSLDGHETLLRLLLVIAAALWVALAALLPLRATRDRARFRADICNPPALTAVAGTAVLGTRLTLLGWQWAGIAMLVLAFVIWAALLGPVLSVLETPTVGASLLVPVSTESLAVLAATLAASAHENWLLVAALAPFALGLCFYVFVIARFDLRQLAVGHGDHLDHGRGARDLNARRRQAHRRREIALDPRSRWRGSQGPRVRAVGPDDAVAAGAARRGGAVATASVRR